MSGNYGHWGGEGGGGQRLMAKTILNFHFDSLNLRLIVIVCGKCKIEIVLFWKAALFLVIVIVIVKILYIYINNIVIVMRLCYVEVAILQ